MTQVETAPAKAEGTPEHPKLPTLHQRLARVASVVGRVHATSRNQFGKAALGIGDVEDAIREPLADEGVLTLWSYVQLEDLDPAKHMLWKAHLKVEFVNADDETDRIQCEWIDIGSNPMAATSFCRKGAYKSLFHIAEESDEGGGPPARPQAPRPNQTTRVTTQPVAYAVTGSASNVMVSQAQRPPQEPPAAPPSTAPVPTPKPPPTTPDAAAVPLPATDGEITNPLYTRAMDVVRKLPAGAPQRLATEVGLPPISPRMLRTLDEAETSVLINMAEIVLERLAAGKPPWADQEVMDIDPTLIPF